MKTSSKYTKQQGTTRFVLLNNIKLVHCLTFQAESQELAFDELFLFQEYFAGLCAEVGQRAICDVGRQHDGLLPRVLTQLLHLKHT